MVGLTLLLKRRKVTMPLRPRKFHGVLGPRRLNSEARCCALSTNEAANQQTEHDSCRRAAPAEHEPCSLHHFTIAGLLIGFTEPCTRKIFHSPFSFRVTAVHEPESGIPFPPRCGLSLPYAARYAHVADKIGLIGD